jgi:hypothetical protein
MKTFFLILICMFVFVPVMAQGPQNGGHSSGGDEKSSACSSALNITSGWNLVSSPVLNPVPDDSVKHLFSSATSEAFKYSGSYITVRTLQHGTGYWLKFPGDESIIPVGSLLDNDTTDVSSNWNIVGSISTPIATSSVSSIPPGLQASNFFGYTSVGGYYVASSIEPGRAYWVKVAASGKLVLSSSIAAPANRIRIVPTDELPPSPPVLENSNPTLQLPKEYALYQAYPNPFNPAATIKFDLPKDSRVTLKVYNLLGQVVTTLSDNQPYQAGTHQSEFNAGKLASGLYFYRITAQSDSKTFTDVKKMLLMK